MASKVRLSGATMSEEWPSEKEILSLCKAKKGHPIQVQDIEDDVFTLLGTGKNYTRLRVICCLNYLLTYC